MNIRRCILTIALAIFVPIVGCEKKNTPSPDDRDTMPVNNTETVPAADNTAKNTVDRSGDTKTPMDQSETGADVKVTADIRRSIMDDDGMSVNAQNCKIITDKSGLVTLRGVVNSQAEKASIEAKAKAVAGATKVDNQLEVKDS